MGETQGDFFYRMGIAMGGILPGKEHGQGQFLQSLRLLVPDPTHGQLS